jgi:hypothetical protein
VENPFRRSAIFTFLSRRCGKGRGNEGKNLWESVETPPSGRLGTLHDLHPLAAVPWDLELPEP